MPRAIDLLSSLFDAWDHTPPSDWRAIIDKVLNDHERRDSDVDGDSLDDAVKVQHWMNTEYKDWKQLLALTVLPTGRIYTRAFWKHLANSGSGPGLASVGMDHYADLCATMLMSEVLQEFQQRDLSEAQELNDAGFEQHFPGGYEQAITLHDQALELAPDFSLALINKGIALKNLKRWDEAISIYDSVINAIDPEFKKAWHNKGAALLDKALNQHDREKSRELIEQAISCFEGALAIDRRYAIAGRTLDNCREILKSLSAQQVELSWVDEHILQQNPQLVGLLQMFEELQRHKNWPAAVRIGEQILKIVPEEPEFQIAVGNAFFEAGEHISAENCFLEAVSKKPDNGRAWLNLARCRLQRQDAIGALEAADAAITHAPGESMAWTNRAAALMSLQQYRESCASAYRAYELDGQNPLALYYMGVGGWLMDNGVDVRPILERLLHQHPDFAGTDQVREILAQIP